MLQALSVLLLRARPVCHLHSPVALFEDGMGGMGGMEVGPDGNVVIEISPDGSVVQVERGREFLAERCEFFREEARQRREAQLVEADQRRQAQLGELETPLVAGVRAVAEELQAREPLCPALGTRSMACLPASSVS